MFIYYLYVHVHVCLFVVCLTDTITFFQSLFLGFGNQLLSQWISFSHWG